MNKVLKVAMTALLTCSPALAATQGQWIHVAVDQPGEDGAVVRVNVPLELAVKVLPLVHHEGISGGKVRMHVGSDDVSAADLRAILEAVRSSRDGEYVTVDGPRQKVRVAKRSGFLLVQIDENKETPKTVDVKVPLAVVDALLAGVEGDELNVAAAIDALAKQGSGDLVTVKDGDSHVRIWVDSSESGK